MWSWISFIGNVITIFSGIPLDIVYSVANIWLIGDFIKKIDEVMPWAKKTSFIMQIFYCVAFAPLVRLVLILPVAWKVFSLSGRFFVALVVAENRELLLACAISDRTEELANFSESNRGCCSCSVSREAVEAMRYLMSEEERLIFTGAGGLGEETLAILSKPLTVEEHEMLEEWEEIAEDCCSAQQLHFTCNDDTKDIVIDCKRLADNPWAEVIGFLVNPFNWAAGDPLPMRLLFIYKLQLLSAISTFLIYGFSVSAGKHDWWTPLKLVSVFSALKQLIGLRALCVITSKYPMNHNGVILTGKFPANTMWDSWCGAVSESFSWGGSVDVWKPVGLSESDSEESSADSEDEAREAMLRQYLG